MASDPRCAHNNCLRTGVIIVAQEAVPNALDQTHDCCGLHAGCAHA